MQFQKLGLIDSLCRAVRSEGYSTPTAIQERAIPHVLAGKDLLGCAQTGTGKTAAFALPILQRLHAGTAGAGGAAGATGAAGAAGQPHHGGNGRGSGGSGSHRVIRALIIAPTRELAAQIGESFRVYGQHTGLRCTVIFGGVSQGPQSQALRDGVDVLVATPGRLLDLLNQRLLSLRDVEVLVLDEADRMLDMGFIHDIRRIIALLPARRQALMFSATMPREIRTLADTILHHPVQVQVATESPAADTVQQALYFVESAAKLALLEHLLKGSQVTRALVFTRTKRGADRVVRGLGRSNLAAAAIHSNKSQNARMRALDSFKRGAVRVLIASDIAARGLDVDDISHVINYDLPGEPETYVHRIGRTGRAGAQGQAVTFCTPEQRDELRAIERLLGRAIPVLQHAIRPGPSAPPPPAPGPRKVEIAHPGHGSAPSDRAGGAPHRPGLPQGPRNEFWRRKRRHRPLDSARSGRSRRRGR